MSKHKIVMTTEECFEVVQILKNYIQDKNVDKDLLSAYNKIDVWNKKCPSSEMNYDYEIPMFKGRDKVVDDEGNEIDKVETILPMKG